MSYQAIKDLVGYAHRTGLIEECERVWAENTLLHAMGLEAWEEPQAARERPLEDILRELLDDAAARGLIHDDVTSCDLFDTELMGRLTPRPGQVIRTFCDRYEKDPRAATDWFYDLCQTSNEISAAMGMNPATVRTRLSRGRETLRRTLCSEEEAQCSMK